MSASSPGKGTLVATFSGGGLSPGARAQRAVDGSWRPDLPFTHADGLKVTLRAAKGVTDPAVLTVPLRLQVPVTDDFRRSYQHPWSLYDTLRLGQRSRPMGAQLLELQISTLLMDEPAQDASDVAVWPYAPEPQKVLDELRYLAGVGPIGKRGNATPFRLTISQPIVWDDDELVNMLAVLTRVEPTQKAGSIGTEYLNLTFLEFEEDELARRRQPREQEKIRAHVLKTTDTLYAMATAFYHQPSAWKQIAAANGISGVLPNSAGDLADWAKRHSKKQLRIPPKAGA